MCTVTVQDEYRKNPDLKKESVEELLEWAKTQPHLPRISGDICAILDPAGITNQSSFIFCTHRNGSDPFSAFELL